MERIRGYVRLACTVASHSKAESQQMFDELVDALDLGESVFEVTLRNRRYTGPQMGHWFENGVAQVGAVAAVRFAVEGYEVRKLAPSYCEQVEP